METIFVYLTTKDKAEALKIGRALVEKKLAACVNFWDGMHSLYRWEGKIEEAEEAVLIAKTTRDLLEDLSAEVKRLHSYSCPAIVALPIQGGNADYLKWISESVKEA